MTQNFFSRLFGGNASRSKQHSQSTQKNATPPTNRHKQSAWRRFLSGFFKDRPEDLIADQSQASAPIHEPTAFKADQLKEAPVDNFPLGVEPKPPADEAAPKPEIFAEAPPAPAPAPIEVEEKFEAASPEPALEPTPVSQPESEEPLEEASDETRHADLAPSEPAVSAEAPGPVIAPSEDLTTSIEPAPTPEAPIIEQTPPQDARSFFARLKDGLTKTSGRLTDGLSSIFTQRKLDDDTLEELEDLLITADLGVAAASRVTASLAEDRFDKEISDTEVKTALAEEVAKTLTPLEKSLSLGGGASPHVILMTGVNGAGKTTTIGKLASKFKAEGKSVMLAAGDTFRAAAIEQLTIWGERTGSKVIARETGADAAGLAFDALQQAKDENIDVLLIDTAGRLQNKRELMDELAKIVRVLKKIDPDAPHDTLLVLDATVGQNAISQAEAFSEIAGVTGLVMTKLDGTARGGVLVALGDKFSLPIHFIGVGEGVDDLQEFNANRFSRALAGLDEEAA